MAVADGCGWLLTTSGLAWLVTAAFYLREWVRRREAEHALRKRREADKKAMVREGWER